ncbi:hypothetical protein BMS3Abin17_00983 [archaeon BMS3Abin17]|nr:hypothetical protein BMS3Abin17_00983 [archaeon BMS3Abin17]HDZ60104.1 hypothetical protein [Candidatus Pacearchaeota archaeon]
MQEKENIIRILEETKISIKNKDIIKLKELSNQTIHTASISQDPDNIAIAVIVYSLGKIIERGYYGQAKLGKEISTNINNSINALKKSDDFELRKSLELFRKSLEMHSKNLKSYIQDVFRKASINKASRIYEHGISMEKTASLLGITMFELAGYAGQTGISDVPLSKTLNAKSRIKLAMEMFE